MTQKISSLVLLAVVYEILVVRGATSSTNSSNSTAGTTEDLDNTRRLELALSILAPVAVLVCGTIIAVAVFKNIHDVNNDLNKVNIQKKEKREGDLKLTKESGLDLDKEIEKDLNMCNAVYTNATAPSRYHQTLKNTFHILQEYIPANYSKMFRNPCWYDFNQIPRSPLIQSSRCYFQVSSNLSLTKQVLEQVKSSNGRHLHCLPTFFLPGFPKCATTTLYRMLIKHPRITPKRCKECGFWLKALTESDTDPDKRMRTLWYLNMFSESTQAIQSNPLSRTLDATVTYAYSSPGEMFCTLPVLFMRVLPEAQFILIMRNPSQRYFSHYWRFVSKHVFQKNKTMLSQYVQGEKALEDFHKYTLDTIGKFHSCTDEKSAFHCVIREDISTKDLKYSLYYYHVAPWLTIIPHERFLFLRTEDLVHDPSLTMSKVWHFLNLHVHDLAETEIEVRNANLIIKDLAIPPHTKDLLDGFFQPHNQLLAQLLSDKRYLWND